MRKGKRVKIAKNVYRDDTRISAQARVGTGKALLRGPERRYPLETPLAIIQAQLLRDRAMLLDEQRQHGGGPVTRGTLAHDVILYFETKPKLSKQLEAEKRFHLAWWCRHFGTRVRATLKAAELQRALNGLMTPSVPGQRSRRATPATQNKYRTSLSNVYTVLDGKNAANPFRDLPRADETAAADVQRDIPYEVVDLILGNIRDRGQGQELSRTKARLQVEAFVHVDRAQLDRMRETDVDLEGGQIRVPRRLKGETVRGKMKPLTPEGIAALRAYKAAGCWDYPNPSNASIYRTWCRARDLTVNEYRDQLPQYDWDRIAQCSPKDLRHTKAAHAFSASGGSLSQTALLLDHADQRTTLRYAKGAVEPQLVVTGHAIAAALAARPRLVPASEAETPRFRTRVPHLGRKEAPQSAKTGQIPRLVKRGSALGFSASTEAKHATKA